MAQFGNWLLVTTSLITAMAIGLSLAGNKKQAFLEASRRLFLASLASGLLVLTVLAFLLVTHDYRVAYVRDYADRTMSLGFLITAVWGGQQGSLSFWAFLQTLFAALVAIWTRKRVSHLAPIAMAVMGGVALFFWLLVLTQSNPFAMADGDTLKSIGLNPLLRNPYMVFHPPTLFLGFAGFSVPLAFAYAALITGKLDDGWLFEVRTWMLVAFGFLSIGNVLGMVWAYQELGWGGYWGWDPVENAALLPWITGTALLHSVLAEQRRGVLRRWNISLIFVTFILVIFGTFLTRSGVIQSVHAFSGATTGPYFLGAMVVMFVSWLFLLFKRFSPLAPKADFATFSKEGMLNITNWVFMFSALFVGGVTISPLYFQLVRGEQITVQPEFYNRAMVPVGIFLFALLGICTLIPWKRLSRANYKSIGAIVAAGVLAGVAAGFLGGYRPELGKLMAAAPAISIGIIVFVGLSILVALRQSVVRENRKKLGGQLVHLGMVLMFVGFTGSGFIVENQGSLGPGESMYIGHYKLTFLGLRTDVSASREAIFADLAVTDGEDFTKVVSPARFFYHSHPGQPTSEVDIEGAPSRDLFFILGETDFKRGRAIIRVLINPLVFWVWVGGLILVIGTIVALTDKGSLLALLKFSPPLRAAVVRPAIWLLAGVLTILGGISLFGLQSTFVGIGSVLLAAMFVALARAVLAMGEGESRQ